MAGHVKVMRLVLMAALVLAAAHADAQPSAAETWRWTFSGNTFAGLNYQHRRFRDFTTFESQNWAMGLVERPLGRGQLTLHTMFSLEPFTLQAIGSPQVFQTGETFDNSRLIDYQHPHDLVTALSAGYTRAVGVWTMAASVAAVGSPALGPPPFMHRPSAAENPQTPLTHHHLDSVHITPGVVTFGVFRSGVGIETSWFRGREPDEDRTDIDFGTLDSWSVRGSWSRGPWSAQLSGARITEPEPLTPGDVTRVVASMAHTRTGAISTALMAAWGHNRERHGNSNGLLVETTISWLARNYLYSRLELVGKDLPHTHGGFLQPSHEMMNIGAFTVGYTRDILSRRLGLVGIGGDTTMYYVPLMLQESYGAPLSFHLFVRYRFGAASHAVDGHHH